MASYKNFEELPVWNAAVDLGVCIFKVTAHESFRFKGDLVNQLRRSVLSVSNNIAEGFERGTTQELITFLYIARGSAGEVRSMLRFALRFDAFTACRADIEALIEPCLSVSKQIRAWLESLQNSDIRGTRYLNDSSRKAFERKQSQAALQAQMAAFRAAMEEGLRNGTWGKGGSQISNQKSPAPSAAEPPES